MDDKQPAQAQLEEAMMFLFGRCDGARSQDNVGFNGGDASNPFLLSMKRIAQEGKTMTYGQMTTLLKKLIKYRKTQLEPAGYALPDEADIKAAVVAKGGPTYLRVNALHADEDFLYLHFIYDHYANQTNMSRLKEAFYEARSTNSKPYCGKFLRGSDEAKLAWLKDMVAHDIKGFWRFPKTPANLTLIFKYFPQSLLKLTQEAQAFMAEVAEAELQAKLEKSRMMEQKRREVEATLAAIGGINFTFGGGKTLFPHQKTGVEFAVAMGRCTNEDETGLGKTLQGLVPAWALQKRFGYKIYIVTTVSSMGDWSDLAEELGAQVEISSWDYRKIPVADNTRPSQPFVLVVDEAHKMASMDSKCTKNILALAWHWNCKATFLLTGTPLPNGRPINKYPLLLAVRSELVYPAGWQLKNYPIVWKEKDDDGVGTLLPERFKYLRRDYEIKYCGAHEEKFRGRRIWDVSGATNLYEFYRRTQYKEGQDNFSSVCSISRRKKECVKLPEKMRHMLKVEVSPEAEKVFKATVAEKWAEFEQYVVDKLEAFKAQIREEEKREATSGEVASKREDIMNAEALVKYQIFRQAGAWAKFETALEHAKTILDEGSKVVIFTSYTDVAKQLGERIEKDTGKKVQYILGEVKKEDRQLAMKDFQSETGETQVIISTAAGGEAITLTAAQHMIIVDRPLTPGRVKQWEDRIHRLTTKGTVTVYWLQLPKDLCEIDDKIDGIIQQKQIQIDAAQYGEASQGLEFVSERQLNRMALAIIEKTAKSLKRKQQGKAKVA
jgi:hypothetical protein